MNVCFAGREMGWIPIWTKNQLPSGVRIYNGLGTTPGAIKPAPVLAMLSNSSRRRAGGVGGCGCTHTGLDLFLSVAVGKCWGRDAQLGLRNCTAEKRNPIANPMHCRTRPVGWNSAPVACRIRIKSKNRHKRWQKWIGRDSRCSEEVAVER